MSESKVSVRRIQHAGWWTGAVLPLLLLLLAPPTALGAQEGTIQGRVVDVQGAPVPGANVRIVNTNLGTLVTDEGNFSLEVPAGTHRVAAAALGYRRVEQSVTVAAGGTVTVNFTLQVSAVELGELVASVEAGDVTRRQLGTDIASIDAASEVEKGAPRNFSNLLNARAGNVTITQTSGNVGGGSRVRVRGVNSLTQDNNPLLIIDGVRATQNTDVGINRGQTFSRLDDLNPQDIQSIEVVKGPSATTLYGSEAAAGVIIVTTKRGSRTEGGAPRITVRTEQGTSWDREDYPDNFADVTQFVTGPDDPLLAAFPVQTNPLTGQVFLTDNPFEDPGNPFRNGRQSEGAVSASGGNQAVSYYSSVQYENNNGVLLSNDQEKLDLRANFSTDPSEMVSISLSTGYTSSEVNLPKSGNNTSGFFSNAFNGIPLSSLGSDGTCAATVLTGEDPSFCDKDGNTRAAFDKIVPIISKQDLERFNGSATATVEPTEWFTVRATAGGDVSNTEFQDAIPFDPDIPFSFAAGGENFLTRNEVRTFTGDVATTVEYGIPILEGLRGTTTGGGQYFQTKDESTACEGRVFPNDQATACDAAVFLRGFSDFEENVEIGAFAQHRFEFRNYAFLTGAIRVDDNSALGDRVDEIWSPSVNGSVVVSDMPFWNVEPVSTFRIRGGWGQASQSPGQFAADRTFVITRVAGPGGTVAGLSPENPGNPDLGPEESSEIELGFNAGLLDDRISVDFTYFDREVRDLILAQPVPPSSGFPQARFTNVGDMENDGFELSLEGRVFDTDDVIWDLRVNWSTNDPVITNLGDEGPIFIGNDQVLSVGEAPGALVSNVIVAAERDANGDIIESSIERLPGTLGDGSGRRVVGNPFSTNQQSLSSTLTLFGGLRLFTLFDRKGGHEVKADGEEDRNPGSLDPINSRFGDRWAFRQTRETAVAQAMMEQNRLVGNHGAVFVHDASFIKFREATLSYQLPRDWARMLGATRTRVYVGGRNLFTITDFPEPFDPEGNENGARDNLTSINGLQLAPPPIVFAGLEMAF